MIDTNLNTTIIFLDLAIEENRLKDFLTGSKKYAVMTKDRYGDIYFAPYYIMDAIYKKYEEVEGLDKKVCEEFASIFKNAENYDLVHRVLRDLEYHKSQEMKGETPFSIDMDYLLKIAEEEMKKPRFKNPDTGELLTGEKWLKQDYYYNRLLKLIQEDSGK